MHDKKIVIFPNGNAGIVDASSSHLVRINGQAPVSTLPATDENIKQYFGDEKKVKGELGKKIR